MSERQLNLYDRLINEPSNDWDIYYWATGTCGQRGGTAPGWAWCAGPLGAVWDRSPHAVPSYFYCRSKAHASRV